MSRYTTEGPFKFIDSEALTVSSTPLALTAASYSKTNPTEEANVAYITTNDNKIYVSFVNDDHSTPSDHTNGIPLTSTMGPFKVHCDLSTVRLIRDTSDADVNVVYGSA